MVGGLNDPVGWNHMDNDAQTVNSLGGSSEIDVDEIKNTGTFEARLKVPEGDLVIAMDRFNEFNPCQNGGIVAALHEHGDKSDQIESRAAFAEKRRPAFKGWKDPQDRYRLPTLDSVKR